MGGSILMEEINTTLTLIKLVEILLGLIIIPLAVAIWNLIKGMRCQLRSDMLHIYYANKDEKKIRQYELENFVYLYKAYKALKGNSFIDKIYTEVMSWEVIT
jgi:hypothetical protein